MARSFSNVKTVSSFIANEISALVTRRGYAAAASSQGVVSSSVRSGAAPNVMLKKATEEPHKTSWVPDPVTGHFRPDTATQEIDAAELRAMLLKNNKNTGQ